MSQFLSALKKSPLNHHSNYPVNYSPEQLLAIDRSLQRANLFGTGMQLPFLGYDLWTSFELSWLDAKGKPKVAIAEFKVPCDSKSLFESKSFKLYLHSFNQERFSSPQQLVERMIDDLSCCVESQVEVFLHQPEEWQRLPFGGWQGLCLDDLDVAIDCYEPDETLLTLRKGVEGSVEEWLYSHLLRSNCPVTGQPDWGSLLVAYRGRAIDHEGLLRYVVSFRNHTDFHEHCIEKIFIDISNRCRPDELLVLGRNTRRGGIDTNPVRYSGSWQVPKQRLIRQ